MASHMMIESGLPRSLKGEILLTSCILRNLTLTSYLLFTPLEMWTRKKPSVEQLRVMGCKAYCELDQIEQKEKYGAKAWMSLLVGYSVDTLGFWLWDLVSHKVWDVQGPNVDETVWGG